MKHQFFKFALAMGVLFTPEIMFAENPFSALSPIRAQQDDQVSGKVLDNLGPLVGANIIVKGTQKGVITDVDGNFILDGIKKGAVLQISHLGYVTQEITYTGQTSLTIHLAEDTQRLDEVVVTALGITKEAKALGYAVSSIDAGEITKVGTSNFATALYGKASGVRISAPPGGSAAGVAINIRGLNSINGNNDPMVFVDGVPIRNGNNNDTYNTFNSVGLRSNGLVDINPEDIENLTILKGASATALYGSEAANGVVMITTKRAKEGSGVSVDFNMTLQANTLAYLPRIQTEYGPGTPTASLDNVHLANNGMGKYTLNGVEYNTPFAINTNRNYGPKFDGSDVLYWDGTVRKYEPTISDNPYKELLRTGFTQTYNVAISQGGKNSATRFSYTYTDESPSGLTGSFKKHNFNLTGMFKFNDKLSLDYSANYILQKFHNRQGQITDAWDSFSNMFSAFTDISRIKSMYKTSLGYKNRPLAEASLTPDESFTLNHQQYNWVRDYFWRQYEVNNYETDNRFIGSIAPQWKIFDFLTLRGRASVDISADRIEIMTPTENPLALYDPSGEYQSVSKNYSIYYGDIMLAFSKNITDKINISANLGMNAREESMLLQSNRTDGGLTVENEFMLGVSRYQIKTDQSRMNLLKTAIYGSIDLSYGNYLFLGVTGRQEKSSTLPHGSNSYFYPSVNGSFLYTDAFRDAIPSWYNYGKVRVSYGIVGNAPAPYAANIVYDQGSGSDVSWSTYPSTLGNSALKPEKIKEVEVGWENKLFNSRLGLELSLYHRQVSDMIVQQPVAISDGVTNMWMNIGTMVNKGVELSLNVVPIETRDFRMAVFTNLSFASNKVTELAPGIDYLRNDGNFGNTGNGVKIRSYAGRAFGDIYVNKVQTVTDENSPYYGQPIVEITGITDENGNLYAEDDPNRAPLGIYRTSEGEANQEYVGNVQPKVIGGLGFNFNYKAFSLDIMTDFRFGGYVLNNAYHYPMANGISKASLAYRDAEHGGLSYMYKGFQRENGMIIPGVVEVVDENGNVSYTPNTTVTPSDDFNNYTFNWGNSGGGTTYQFSVMKNSYWKLREVAIGYDLPKNLISKLYFKNLRVSLFGRNLFYFYKTLDEIDPEANNGGRTDWLGQTGVGYSASPSRTFGFSLRATF